MDVIPNQTVTQINRVLQFLAVKDPKSSMKERNGKALQFIKLQEIINRNVNLTMLPAKPIDQN